MLVGIFTDVRLTGTLYPTSFIYLFEKDPPRLVLRAEPILTSIGERSSPTEARLFPTMRGSIFLGYSSLNDFFLVCWIKEEIRRIGGWFIAKAWGVAYCCWGYFWICRDD